MNLLTRGWNALFHPTVRLPTEFPLSGAKFGRTYLFAMLWFAAGTLVPVLLFFGYMFVMASLSSSHPAVAARMRELAFEANGMPSLATFVIVLLGSFVLGFVLEMRYIKRVMGVGMGSFVKQLGFRIDTRKRATWLRTGWAIVWPALVAFAIIMALQVVLPMVLPFQHEEQSTVAFARKLSSDSLWGFFVLTVICAPLLEELAFRGFLMQSFRATFDKWRALPGTEDAQRKRVTAWIGAKVLNTSTAVDMAAIVLSSAIFAVQHLQFNPLTLIMLFCAGAVFAETFRRTGSLWTNVGAHALMNATATVVIMLGLE